jgi:cold shock CspA family protein
MSDTEADNGATFASEAPEGAAEEPVAAGAEECAPQSGEEAEEEPQDGSERHSGVVKWFNGTKGALRWPVRPRIPPEPLPHPALILTRRPTSPASPSPPPLPPPPLSAGFGFITLEGSVEEVFVHQSNISTSGYRSLREGEAVEFDLAAAPDGKLKAFSVTGPGGAAPLGSRDAPRAPPLFGGRGGPGGRAGGSGGGGGGGGGAGPRGGDPAPYDPGYAAAAAHAAYVAYVAAAQQQHAQHAQQHGGGGGGAPRGAADGEPPAPGVAVVGSPPPGAVYGAPTGALPPPEAAAAAAAYYGGGYYAAAVPPAAYGGYAGAMVAPYGAGARGGGPGGPPGAGAPGAGAPAGSPPGGSTRGFFPGGRNWAGARPPPPGQPGFSSGLQVVVHNLPWDCTWQALRDAFAPCGEVERADVVFDSRGRSRGFGIVRFPDRESAAGAVEKMNDAAIGGRVVSVRLDRFA